MSKRKEGYYIEHNGDCWQSIFPANEADKSQLHVDIQDVYNYIVERVGLVNITIVQDQIANEIVPKGNYDSIVENLSN